MLGPARARQDDVRRYCLPCSAKKGRLVERKAPAIVRARKRQLEAAAAFRRSLRAKSESYRKKYYTVAGINVLDQLRGWLSLKAWGDRRARMMTNPPTLRIRRCARVPETRGRASYRKHEIMLASYPFVDEADVLETLLHELAHFAAPSGHDTRWRTVFRKACEEALGVRPRLERCTHGEVSELLRDKAEAEALAKMDAARPAAADRVSGVQTERR